MDTRKVVELYIKNNWQVIPLVSGEKFPVSQASDYNNREFTVNDFEDNSNVGVKTGTGIVVIDVDISNAEKRKKFIDSICERAKLNIEQLLFQTTASGRVHLFFKTDKEIQSIMRVPFEGEFVDLLGKGRYCVVYPSVVRGKDGKIRQYRFFKIKGGTRVFIHPGQPNFFDNILFF
jgi:hypothetical protein